MFLHVNTIKYYTSTTIFSPSFANFTFGVLPLSIMKITVNVNNEG